jgi:uncharacterized protein
MIEITPYTTNPDKKLDGKKASRGARATGEASFDQVLSRTTERESERGIDSLMNDLRDQERRFLDAQSLFELQKYKQLLQKLLRLIMDESFKTEIIPRGRRNRADFLIVNRINEKVDELSRSLASSDNKAFALMKTLEEIRGLLCDLVH